MSILILILGFKGLTPRTPDLEDRSASLPRRVVFLDKELYSATLSLFTGQVY